MREPEVETEAAGGDPEEIPDKLYFRIGEVARLAGIKPYVLRFWETEFPSLGPKKSGTGHRLYRRKEVELVLEIKQLLHEKRYTIEGARKFLDARLKDARSKDTRGKEARVKSDVARSSSSKASSVKAAQLQGSLFDVPSPMVLEAIRKELREIAELLKK
jgi:DNA-binding transcriptional MerR regulator